MGMLGKPFLSLFSKYVKALKALIGLSQRPRSGTENNRPMTALPKIEGLWQTNQSCLPRFESIRSVTYLALSNLKAVVSCWTQEWKMLQRNNIYERGMANLPFPARLEPQKWLYLTNTFLAPRGVAALVPVSDDKTQITLLILGRGALSNHP